MPKLAVSEHEIVKISKKGTLEKIWPILGFYTKESPKFVIHAFYENLLEPKVWLIAKKKIFFLDSSLSIINSN